MFFIRVKKFSSINLFNKFNQLRLFRISFFSLIQEEIVRN